MHAVVRLSNFIPHGVDLEAFHAAHTAHPGYRGTLTINLGASRQLVINLWDSPDGAAAGRTVMTPIVAAELAPHLSRPSQLLGAGPVSWTATPGSTRGSLHDYRAGRE